MGFCANDSSFKALENIDKLCRATTGSGNAWRDGDKEYFYEVSRRDRADGGIGGSVHLMLPDNRAKRVGTFLIDRDGQVVRGSKLLKSCSVQRPAAMFQIF